jgi:shikimate dehydrogenase
MKITGKTRIAGIFGYPVEHTLSPAMHNSAFEALGLNCCYVPFSVHPDRLSSAMDAVRALNLLGVNVTVPHKEKVLPMLDEIDDEASFIGAVNTVVNTDGRLKGYNTDGRGFMQSLSESRIEVKGRVVLILGAGGAARAIGYYLARKAKALSIYGRTAEKAERLATDLKKVSDNVSALRRISRPDKFQVIINATPLGLKNGDPLPIDTASLDNRQIVCDLIYRNTRFLAEASGKGCITLNGLGMLLWQGVFAFELWTGRKPDVGIMRKALISSIA